MNPLSRFLTTLIALTFTLQLYAQVQQPDTQPLSGNLIIFNAGSLSVPFKKIAQAFMAQHTDVKIQLEAAGSRDCARKISDLKRPCDVMASADYLVIDQLLIPEHASWNIKFATNEMCIVYHDASRRSAEINAQNWMEILLDPKVAFARSNPNADPCGYRAIMTIKLAETHYRRPGFAETMLQKDLNFVRPKETDLLALLESNTIDYIFLYRSVAQQHGLKFLVLPDEMNLKKADLADLYRTVSVELTGKKIGEFVTQHGEPMVYGITIPHNAPNPRVALAFVQFVLQAETGMNLIEFSGQATAVPSICPQFDKLPTALQPFATPPKK